MVPDAIPRIMTTAESRQPRWTTSTETYTTTTATFFGYPQVITTTTEIRVRNTLAASNEPTDGPLQNCPAFGCPSGAPLLGSSSPSQAQSTGAPQPSNTADNGQSTATAGATSGQNAGAASHKSDDGISGGSIAAAVIVPIVVITALIIGLIFFLRRRKQRKANRENAEYQQHTSSGPDMTETAGRGHEGPPTLNHIVSGELERETGAARGDRSSTGSGGMKRGASAYVRKPVPAATRHSNPPQLGDETIRPVSPINDGPYATPQKNPFATPPDTVNNTPDDAPHYLNGASTVLPGPARHSKQDELFMSSPPPATGAVGRHWHSTNGQSRFNGRDPRTNTERPTSPGMSDGEISDFDEDDTVEIGEATAAPAHRQRASVIDMTHLGAGNGNGSPRGSSEA